MNTHVCGSGFSREKVQRLIKARTIDYQEVI